MMKRIFLIVLDSCGAGALPDAHLFGDAGTHTLRSCYDTGLLEIPNLLKMGLGNVAGLEFLGSNPQPTAAWGRMAERSMGKDTTIGHWELAGLVSPAPLPTYPEGFPEAVLEPFRQQTGRGVLANAPWSGTAVIDAYGKAHMETGDLIIYTSADSVFQIAAHEDVVPPEQLYTYCRIARNILRGEHGVGRVIARPFVGTPGNFSRTANRHDFSLEPPGRALPQAIAEAGLASIGVGKIPDIFAGCGITQPVHTKSNADGMEKTLALAEQDFQGLCFVNLVEFDSHYGHRRDPEGYARALNAFDLWLPRLLERLGSEDAVIITADHGCDPGYSASTDHTREYVPLLVQGAAVTPCDLGTRTSFADVAATVAKLLGVSLASPGIPFDKQIM